jgi:hypothetical protein
MKATLEIDISTGEGNELFLQHLNGPKYKMAIDDFDNKLRAMYKYENKDVIELDHARKLLAECVAEYLE